MGIVSASPTYYQKNPPKIINPRGDRRWTTSINGYCYEALNLTRKLIANGQLDPYTHWCTIYICHDHTIPEVKQVWTKATRLFRQKHISAEWIREISQTNRFHYHLVCRNPEYTPEQVYSIIKLALPDITTNVQVRPYIPQFLVANSFYFTKAKCQGWVNGRLVKDKHSKKRYLVHKCLGLCKHGTISKSFWDADTDTRVEENLAAWNKRRERLCSHRGQTALENLTRWVGDSIHEDMITKMVIENWSDFDAWFFNDEI